MPSFIVLGGLEDTFTGAVGWWWISSDNQVNPSLPRAGAWLWFCRNKRWTVKNLRNTEPQSVQTFLREKSTKPQAGRGGRWQGDLCIRQKPCLHTIIVEFQANYLIIKMNEKIKITMRLKLKMRIELKMAKLKMNLMLRMKLRLGWSCRWGWSILLSINKVRLLQCDNHWIELG